MPYSILIISLFFIFLGLPSLQGFIIYQLRKRKPEEYNQVTKGRLNFYTIDFARYLFRIREEDDAFLKRVKIINLIFMITSIIYVIYIINNYNQTI
jgi:hypothetical protein